MARALRALLKCRIPVELNRLIRKQAKKRGITLNEYQEQALRAEAGREEIRLRMRDFRREAMAEKHAEQVADYKATIERQEQLIEERQEAHLKLNREYGQLEDRYLLLTHDCEELRNEHERLKRKHDELGDEHQAVLERGLALQQEKTDLTIENKLLRDTLDAISERAWLKRLKKLLSRKTSV